MFKKLRNKLIIINLGVTSVVILAVFSAIYVFSTRQANMRPPMPENKLEIYSDDVENVITVSLENEKRAAANDLLVMLIVSGLAIELVVAFVSYFLAEEAIKPVRDAYESQKVFIANASHEIKTPLAAISANLEAADIHGNKWISNIEKETAKLSALNNDLLTLARTDLVNETALDDVELAGATDKLIQSFEPRLGKIDFSKNYTAHGKVKIPLADYSQVFDILMDNAIKYCDKKISLRLSNHELILSNDGAIINEDDAKHIFDRFYQVDKTAEGVGLGLSIAKSVADRNGWVLSAKNDGSMTSFVLKF